VARLQGALKAEAQTRPEGANQLQALEEKIAALTQENADLKRDMQEHEENFQEQLTNLQQKFDATTSELSRLKKMINAMVASLVGKHNPLKPGKFSYTRPGI
jgi:chromosome segregation ATPase